VPDTAFTSDQLVVLLRRYLEINKGNKELGSKPMGLVLMRAFQEIFPCDAEQK
jgi:hypothetical protein